MLYRNERPPITESASSHGLKSLPISLFVACMLFTAPSVQAVPAISALAPSVASPQPVGTGIIWTVTASDTDAGLLLYQFGVQLPGSGASLAITRDYHTSKWFKMTPSVTDGTYTVLVTVKNAATRQTSSLQAIFVATSLVTGNIPVVNRTSNPLVALYSSPACPVGGKMAVAFALLGSSTPTYTSPYPCTGSSSMNFYVAGMLPNTTYWLRHKLVAGGGTTWGSPLSFTTGAIPKSIAAIIPPVTVVRPAGPKTSTSDDLLLVDYWSKNNSVHIPTAVDLAGNAVWFYPSLPPALSHYYLRPLPGGTMLIHITDPTITVPNAIFQSDQLLREFDLAGNTVRETNVAQVASLVATMYPSWNICAWTPPTTCSTGQTAATQFHHDAVRLPNGHTLALVKVEKLFTDGTQGSSPHNPVDILGDLVVDLDMNLQVAWAFNSFQSMNPNRKAVLHDRCQLSDICLINFAPVANDWLHSNTVYYIPADGNLLISMRNQDLVVKVDYRDGTGTGAVLWRLGKDGDFTMTGTSDPYPWFSHQHDVGYQTGISNTAPTQVLSLFDNANTRAAPPPVGIGAGNSRGYVLSIDHTNMTVTPLLLADLGTYSHSVGSAQRLSNGNYHFESGNINAPDGLVTNTSQSVEVIPDSVNGTLDYTLLKNSIAYRSYRMTSLYSGAAR